MIEVGGKCIASGGEIKKIFAIVKCSSVNGMINFHVHSNQIKNGEYVDLQGREINFSRYVGYWCDMWGDFFVKTTSTGKIKHKFLVLRIEKKHKGGHLEKC